MAAPSPLGPALPIRRRPVACVVLAGNVVLTVVVIVTNLVAGDVKAAAVTGIVFAALWMALTVLAFGPLTRGSATSRDVRLLQTWRNIGIVVAALSVVGTVLLVVALSSSRAVTFDAAIAYLVFVDAVRIAVIVFGVVVAQQALNDLKAAVRAA